MPVEPWSMDVAADRLMDDVFADVDRMIETGSEPPAKAAEPEYVSLNQIPIPSITLPRGSVSSQVPASDSSETEAQKTHDEGRSLNKLLLGGAIASLAITLLLWLAGQGRLNRLFGIQTASETEAPKTLSQADNQFIDYMQRSLDLIEDKEANKEAVAVVPTPPLVNTIPVPSPGNLPQPPTRPQSVLERVYIPVFPRPQVVYGNPAGQTIPKNAPTVAAAARPRANSSPSAIALPQIPAVSTVAPAPATKAKPSPTVVAIPQIPAVSTAAPAARPAAKPSPTVIGLPQIPAVSTAAPAARPTAKPSPSVVASSRPSASPSVTPSSRPTVTASASPRVATSPQPAPAATSTPRVAAAPAPASQPTSRPDQTTQAAAPVPAIKHTLMGVLVLGDKSAAIFEVNGGSRRIHVGESIGSSGWTLVEVKNDEAVIRRNGEVRSIYVGQQF